MDALNDLQSLIAESLTALSGNRDEVLRHDEELNAAISERDNVAERYGDAVAEVIAHKVLAPEFLAAHGHPRPRGAKSDAEQLTLSPDEVGSYVQEALAQLDEYRGVVATHDSRVRDLTAERDSANDRYRTAVSEVIDQKLVTRDLLARMGHTPRGVRR